MNHFKIFLLFSFTLCIGCLSYANSIPEKTYPFNDPHINFLGRTYSDNKAQVTYFNWTCSGFEFEFEGNKLEANLQTILVEEDGQILYPWISVFIDDFDRPYKVLELKKTNGTYTLFEDKESGTHRIKVIKRTEALHSKTGLSSIHIYGKNAKINSLVTDNPHTIEFIGDSITCGYGNESNNPEDGFQTPQENGWGTFAALTARTLQANFNCISISGIGIYSNWTPTNQINTKLLMPEIYADTDTYLDLIKERSIMPWNFEKFKPELIVLELGSNDMSYIKFDTDTRFPIFKEKYINFLTYVRQKNGAEPKILCTIVIPEESLRNLYTDLFNEIFKEYQNLTGDPNTDIVFLSPPQIEDGIGGSWHPTLKTHERMAQELTSKIREWLHW